MGKEYHPHASLPELALDTILAKTDARLEIQMSILGHLARPSDTSARCWQATPMRWRRTCPPIA